MPDSSPHSEEALQLARALIIEIPEEDLAKSGLLLLSQEVIRLHEQNEALTKALTALIGWSDDENGDDFGTTEWANARALVTNPAKERP